MILDALRELSPWLVALYLVECVYRVAPGQLLFVGRPGGRYRCLGAGWRLTGWLPGDRAFRASLPLLSMSRDGLLLLRPDRRDDLLRFRRESYDRLSWSEAARAVAEDEDVRFPRLGATVPCLAPTAARASVERIHALAALDRETRARRLAEERSDRAAAARPEALLALWAPALRLLDVSGGLLVAVAVAAAAVATLGGLVTLPVTGRELGLVLALTWGVHVAQVAVAARRLRRAGLRAPRGSLLGLMVYPPAAAHGGIGVVRDALVAADPLEIAAALLPPEQTRVLLRRELHGAACARTQSNESEWLDLWAERAAVAERVARGLGLDPAGLLGPASGAREDARHCPLCLGEFRAGLETCPDCRTPLLGSAL